MNQGIKSCCVSLQVLKNLYYYLVEEEVKMAKSDAECKCTVVLSLILFILPFWGFNIALTSSLVECIKIFFCLLILPPVHTSKSFNLYPTSLSLIWIKTNPTAYIPVKIGMYTQKPELMSLKEYFTIIYTNIK